MIETSFNSHNYNIKLMNVLSTKLYIVTKSDKSNRLTYHLMLIMWRGICYSS